MLLPMDDDGHDECVDALREAAIMLASRIRIALPYRPAARGDIAAVDRELERLHAAGLGTGDAAVEELANLRETLLILAIGNDR